VSSQAPGAKVGGLTGDLVGAEAMVVLKDLMARLGGTVECRQDEALVDPCLRSGFACNSRFRGVEKADCVLLVGAVPRFEASALNIKLRKNARLGLSTVFNVGPPVDLTCPVEQLGDNPSVLDDLLNEQTHPATAALAAADRPVVLVGPGMPRRHDWAGIWSRVCRLATDVVPGLVRPDWNGINLMHMVRGHRHRHCGSVTLSLNHSD
jgi:NADH-quinone oxidoreductase subunit G